MDILLIAGLWLDGSAWDDVASALEPLGHRHPQLLVLVPEHFAPEGPDPPRESLEAISFRRQERERRHIDDRQVESARPQVEQSCDAPPGGARGRASGERRRS